MKIAEYSEKYDEALKSIDELSFLTVKYHQDVIKSSVCVALKGKKVMGAGFLKAGATFLRIEDDLPYYFIHAEYFADNTADPVDQIEASEMILEELKDCFNSIQDTYPHKRLILRLWSDSKKTAYLEFLIFHGFRPMRISPVLVRELDDECDSEELSEIIDTGTCEKLVIKDMDPNDDRFMEEYLITNGEAFEVPDSAQELKFITGGEDSHVFAVMSGNRVIASVTTWKISEKRAATENIFCAADHRRRGITAYLINYVCSFLYKKGYSEASLSVFGDNQPAEQLYLKLGYMLEGCMIECHYERDYKNIGF